MAAPIQPEDNTWKSQGFRQNVISKIEKVILECGSPTRKNVAEMENEVFLKAKTKNEYLTFVIQIINQIKSASKQQIGGVQMGPGMVQQNQPGGPSGQMIGQSQNIGMIGQMNSMNQMGQMGVNNVMNQQGMQQQQMVQQGMQQSQQPGNINMAQQQQQPGGMSQQTGGINMPQQLSGMNMPQQLSGMNMPQQQQHTGMNMPQQQQQQQNQPGGMPGTQQQQQQPGGIIPQQLVRMNMPQQPGGMTMGQQLRGMGMAQQQQNQPGGMNITQQQANPQQNIQIGQQQQQNPQQNQMMNSNFMAQQQRMQLLQQQQQQQQQQNTMNTSQGQMQQNPTMTTQQTQQQLQNQMNNNQMQQLQQIQNAQIQQAFLQQQQQNQANQSQQQPQMANQQQHQMMTVRGMNPQMAQGRMTGPQTMANQLSAMAAQQRKAPQHRPLGANAMGINRPMHVPFYGGNGLNMNDLYGPNMPQVDNVPMGNQYVGQPGQGQSIGGPPMQRPPGGPFMPPSPGMQMGPTPSPNPMSSGQNQSSFVNSPQNISHPHGSPGPGAMRAFSNNMVPSPNTNLGTPMPNAPVPSPINAEEQACIQKIKELKKYTDLLQRMIAKIGNKDVEKSSKMKKLLEVLTNPNPRIKMDILLKCEAALQHMERQQHETGSVPETAPQPMPIPTKDQISPIQQIEEAVLTALKNGSSSHTFLRTFKPTVEALTGQPIGRSESPDESDCDFETENEPTSDIPWVLQRDLKILDSRFQVKIKKNKDQPIPLQLFVTLADQRLPRVPPLTILIPNDYPDESPKVIDLKKEYNATPLFNDVSQALKSRLLYLPAKFSVLELLNCWEMSVRQVSNPNPSRNNERIKRQRLESQPGATNFALSFM